MNTTPAFQYALTQTNAPNGRVLWLYGDPSIATGVVYHPLYDQAKVLQARGCTVFSDIDILGDTYDTVFVNCPKQREETEGLLALAMQKSKGFVMVAAANDAGGGRLAGFMEAYGVPVEQASKNRCRVAWTMAAGQANKSLIEKNKAQLALQQIDIAGEKWWSVAGIFAWDKIDHGSALLLQHLPPNLSGNVADFGCGYGYLSVMLSRRYPNIESIDAYDVDMRAVTACTRNGNEKIHTHWQDIRTLTPHKPYDAIVMNPPFHSGKEENASLGETFIRSAWNCLKPQGRLFLVANRQLPYEKVVPGLSIFFEGEGYKIITGRKP